MMFLDEICNDLGCDNSRFFGLIKLSFLLKKSILDFVLFGIHSYQVLEKKLVFEKLSNDFTHMFVILGSFFEEFIGFVWVFFYERDKNHFSGFLQLTLFNSGKVFSNFDGFLTFSFNSSNSFESFF